MKPALKLPYVIDNQTDTLADILRGEGQKVRPFTLHSLSDLASLGDGPGSGVDIGYSTLATQNFKGAGVFSEQ